MNILALWKRQLRGVLMMQDKGMFDKRVYSANRQGRIIDKGIYNGFSFYIVSYGSHPCIYIEIPSSHKFYQKDYDDIDDFQCHGGLTFSSSHLLNMDDSWFIGWDYAHLGDYAFYPPYYDEPWSRFLLEHNEAGHMWTAEELLQEALSAIEQL